MGSSEEFFLKWNQFQDNTETSFKNMRDDHFFTNVTLMSEDKLQIEAHKVILASSSKFFMDILKENKQLHPLIYLRGVKAKDLVAVIDFIYNGQVTVLQNNLEHFMAIAEELELKGLVSNIQEQKDVSSEYNDQKEMYLENNFKVDPEKKLMSEVNRKPSIVPKQNYKIPEALVDVKDVVRSVNSVGTLNTTNPDDLNATIDEMVEKVDEGWSCKYCDKITTRKFNMRAHVETNHMEAVSYPCAQCDYITGSRTKMAHHQKKAHKNI